MDSPQTSKPPKSLWPVSIIVFFAVAILGCVGFVVFCSMHGTELVASDYYEREIRYQSEMDRISRASSLGEAASITYTPDSDSVLAVIPAAHVSSGATGHIELYRASAARMDRKIQLAPNAAGLQQVSVAELAPGPWSVKLTWESGGQAYQINQNIIVKSKP